VTPTRLRVGVNLLWLVPGVVGGSEEYATRCIGALLDDPHDVELVLFARRSFAAAHPDIASRCEVVTPPFDHGGRIVRVLAESSWLPIATRRRRVDVVHHLGGRVPLVSTTPAVVMVHDLQPLDHPENFSPVKQRFLARALPRSVRRARAVVTPSEFVRTGIIERFGVDPATITALAAPLPPPFPELVREERVMGRSSLTSAEVGNVVGEAPFFLYPAITYAHKNHAVLVEAFARLHAKRPDVRLVLTGRAGPCEDALREQIQRLGIADAVVRTGRVPQAELRRLVHDAVALTFPSRYEGFGLPVVEAMAAGCPVIAADATALPEVVDGAGVLVGPDDVDGWCAAMAAQLDADRPAAAARSRARAEHYRGRDVASRLVAIYHAAAAGRR
jgi:alpha-1,3-rhamnosyl/mannosyltransferase